MKLFVIIGPQRSGTTLLASMLGRHPEINMLFESVNKDVLKLIGKEWKGNKLCVPRQIQLSRRSSKWGHLVNRLVNFDFKIKNRYQNLRPYPISCMSIEDYKKEGAVFITIERDKKSTVSSMMKRAGLTQRQANKEYNLGMDIVNVLKNEGAFSISFLDLINNPEDTLMDICNFLKVNYYDSMLDGPKYNIIYPHDSIIKKKS